MEWRQRDIFSIAKYHPDTFYTKWYIKVLHDRKSVLRTKTHPYQYVSLSHTHTFTRRKITQLGDTLFKTFPNPSVVSQFEKYVFLCGLSGCLATMLPLRHGPIKRPAFIHSPHWFLVPLKKSNMALQKIFPVTFWWGVRAGNPPCSEQTSYPRSLHWKEAGVPSHIENPPPPSVLGSLSCSELEFNKEPLLLWAWKAYWITVWVIRDNFNKWNASQTSQNNVALCLDGNYNSLPFSYLSCTFK